MAPVKFQDIGYLLKTTRYLKNKGGITLLTGGGIGIRVKVDQSNMKFFKKGLLGINY